MGAQVVDADDGVEEGARAVDGGVVGFGGVGFGDVEGFVGGGDLELVVVGGGGVGEDADAALWVSWRFGKPGDGGWGMGDGGRGTYMNSAIMLSSM